MNLYEPFMSNFDDFIRGRLQQDINLTITEILKQQLQRPRSGNDPGLPAKD